MSNSAIAASGLRKALGEKIVLDGLDLSSKDGHVRNELDGDRAPDESELAIAARARTQHGDINIQRAR